MEKMIPNTTETTTKANPVPAKASESKPKAPKVTFGLLKEVPIEDVWNDNGYADSKGGFGVCTSRYG